jgi:Molecular chaperone (small heat shock protein)
MDKKWTMADLLVELSKIFRKIMTSTDTGKTNVYGLSMDVTSDGVEIRFSDLGENIGFEREPLLEVFESKDRVSVVAEISGLEKKDLKIKPTESSIRIETKDGRLSETIDLPCEIDPNGGNVTLLNGVLEITLKKLE